MKIHINLKSLKNTMNIYWLERGNTVVNCQRGKEQNHFWRTVDRLPLLGEKWEMKFKRDEMDGV